MALIFIPLTNKDLRTKLKIYLRKRKEKAAKEFFKNSKVDFNGYKRVYHFHIRKSAGTSVNAAFWALGGLSLKKLKREPIAIGKNIIFVRNSKTLIEDGNYHYANSHFPFWALDIPKETFTFCFFRDPYQRLVSLYKYLKWVQEMPIEAKKTDPYFVSLKKEARFVENGFSDYLDNLSKKHLMNQLFMFSKDLNIEEAVDNVNKVSAVFFQHNFDNSIQSLSQILNLGLTIKSERRHSNKLSIDISVPEKNKAIQFLEPEYRFYNIIKKKYEH